MSADKKSHGETHSPKDPNLAASEVSEAAITAIIPALHAYALTRLGSGPHADDAVQDTLERAWRARDTFKDGSSVRGWLFRIMSNRIIDGFRTNRRTVQDVDGETASRLVTQPDQLWRLEYADLLTAIETLTPNMRRALLLTGLGMTHVEGAAAMECALGTFKSYVRRGRSILLAST
jgi:RNA polymerase sigma-70 factor (ECF subfamily)